MQLHVNSTLCRDKIRAEIPTEIIKETEYMTETRNMCWALSVNTVFPAQAFQWISETKLQQNFFNLIFDNKTGSLAFYQKKKASWMKQAYIRHTFKTASSSTAEQWKAEQEHQPLWYLLTPCLLLHQLLELWRLQETEEDPDDPEWADGDIKMKYSSD